MKTAVKHECPNCKSTNVVPNKGATQFWCRKCGAEWRAKANA